MFSFGCNVTQAGSFLVKASAWNRISQQAAEVTLQAQHPVLDRFSVENDSPVLTPPGEMTSVT